MPQGSRSAQPATTRRRPCRARSARQRPKPPPSRLKLKRPRVPEDICIARIGAAHGTRGAVRLFTFTEDPFAVLRYGPLSTKDETQRFKLTHVREAKGHLVAEF